MATCDTNIIQINECDDIYLVNAEYNIVTEDLVLTLNNGVTYTLTIPNSEVQISSTEGNQVSLLVDGLYVPIPSFGVNSLLYEQGNGLTIQSDDDTVDITSTKVGTNVIVDLSVPNDEDKHPALTVTPNQAFNFNETDQILQIPLPTLTRVSDYLFNYAANDNSGTTFSITLHKPLSITANGTYNFDAANQTLTLPLPNITDNEDGTFTVDNGDGTATFTIDTTVDIDEAFNTHSLGDLGDVNLTGLTTGKSIIWNGTAWVPGVTDLDTAELIDNEDGTYTFTSAGGTSIVINTTTQVNQPFSKPGQSQLTRDTGITTSETIYRNGSIGVGLLSTDTVLGRVHIKDGALVVQELGNIAIIRVLFNDQEFIIGGEKINDINEFTINTPTRKVLNVDDNGNLGVTSLSEDKYSAVDTFTLSAIAGQSKAPNCPFDLVSVTEFVIVV